jgi:hypothetical protein
MAAQETSLSELNEGECYIVNVRYDCKTKTGDKKRAHVVRKMTSSTSSRAKLKRKHETCRKPNVQSMFTQASMV